MKAMIMLLLGAYAVIAQVPEPTTAPELVTAKAKYAEKLEFIQTDYTTKVSTATSKYRDDLGKLMESAAKRGDLKGVKGVQAEIDGLNANKLPDDPPAIVRAARDMFIRAYESAQKTRDSQTVQLETGYRKFLVGLVSDLTKAGRIADAEACQAALDSFGTPAPVDKPEEAPKAARPLQNQQPAGAKQVIAVTEQLKTTPFDADAVTLWVDRTYVITSYGNLPKLEQQAFKKCTKAYRQAVHNGDLASPVPLSGTGTVYAVTYREPPNLEDLTKLGFEMVGTIIINADMGDSTRVYKLVLNNSSTYVPLSTGGYNRVVFTYGKVKLLQQLEITQ